MSCKYNYDGLVFEDISGLRTYVSQKLNSMPVSKRYEGGVQTEIIEEANRVETQTFGQDLVKSVDSYVYIPTLMIDFEGEVSDNYQYVEVKNMYLTDVDSVRFDVHREFLEGLSEEAWLEDIDSVSKVLRDIEEELIESNVDVIGLRDIAEDVQTVKEILRRVGVLKNNPNKENAKSLSDILQRVFPNNLNSFVLDLPDVYEGKSIVNVEANYSETNLFLEQGLIKIGDNLYHKVERDSLETVYGILYRQFLSGEIVVPNKFITVEDIRNPENINIVVENIKSFVLSRDVGYEVEGSVIEEISALQVLHQHLPIPERVLRDDIGTSVEYLRRDFVRDFYNEVLKEKFENSALYNKTLRYFKFTDGGLSFHGLSFDINEMPLSQELSDYIKIKKQVGKLGQAQEGVAYRNEDLYYLNNPRKIKEGFGVEFLKDGLYATDLGNPLYIRTDSNSVARRLVDTPTKSLYKEVAIPIDNVYNITDLNFSADIVADVKVLEEWERNNINIGKVIDTSELGGNVKKTTNLTSLDLQGALNNGIVIESLNKETKEKYDDCSI